MMRGAPLLALSGCLLVADEPPHLQCEGLICANNLRCDVEIGECPLACVDDFDCGDGYVCRSGCVAACIEDECADGFACDVTENACFDECSSDDQCRLGFHCGPTGNRCPSD